MTRRPALIVMAVAMILAGCGGWHTEIIAPEIRVALPNDWITWLPVEIAESRGFFAQEAVRVSIAETNGLGKGMEALLGGSVDITAGTLSQAIQLATAGREVRCFITLYTRAPIALAVAPAMMGTIRSVRDLRGHRVGVASPGSASHQFLQFVLVSHDLATQDVDAIALGTGPPSVAALEHGTVDAGILLGAAIPTFERLHADTRFLLDTRTAQGAQQVFGSPLFPNACLIAQNEWLTTHADAARRVVRAVRQAMAWMRAHTPEEIRAAMPETSHIPDASAELLAIRQAQQTLSPDGVMSAESAERIRQYVATFTDRARVAPIPLARIYSNDYIASP
jgi:NitT/TauT family transport system substrate-binding protein